MSEVFKKYVPAAFTYIAARNLDIAQAAQALGISATAIGAAIAKENDAYETRQGAVGFLDRRLDDYVRLQTFRLGDTMLRSEATAATALGLDEQLKGTAGKALKFAFPTLADVGIANIKVSTAIKLLDDYLANYPADPLGLKDYRNDTGRFVRDLIDPRTPVTALVSALMVKEAQDFYLKPAVDGQGRQLNIDPATWGAMSPEVHDGLTTMYFTMGKNVMEAKRADNIARNGVYDPRLGEGGTGDDLISTGNSDDWIAAGKGNDVIDGGNGRNLYAFNRGDGTDILSNSGNGRDTVSLGGSIRYADLSLAKAGNDLVLNMGQGDGMTLKNWYLGGNAKNVEKLQVVTVGGDYDATSTDKTRNKQVEVFDFSKLVQKFDAARAAGAANANGWTVMNGLLDAHLQGSNTAALGGDLSYQYATTGSLAGIGLGAAQSSLAAGTDWQNLKSRSQLEQGSIRLMG